MAEAYTPVPLKDRVFRSKSLQVRPPITVDSQVVDRPHVYRNGYNEEKLQRACKAITRGLSVRRASDEFGIPKSTLYDHVSGRVTTGARSGPRSYLTSLEEKELVNFILKFSSLGYSRSKKQIIELVQQTVDRKGIQATVSPSWWKSFQSRHPELVLKNAEPMSHFRLQGTSPAILNDYFDLLERTLEKCKLTDKPCQIFNLDESGFPLSPNPPKVVAKRGEKHPICIKGQDKCQITVLACVSASGYTIPPLVIFDRKTLKEELIEEVAGTMYALSSSGWMDSEIFEEWFSNHFIPYAPDHRPLLLLMDGHSSHFSPSFVNRAAEENIEVLCLPPNTTHKTQPLDRGVFGPLKRCWREECHDYIRRNPGKVVTRYQFSSIFGQAWIKGVHPANIISGFRVTGIYPVNRQSYTSSSS